MTTLVQTLSQLTARGDVDYDNFNTASCTVATCPLDSSYYFYRMSLAANAIFLVLFSLSLLGFIVVYALTRRGFAFTLAMCIGVAMEVVGYIGRIMSWSNQWMENGFLIQIICLTIAPAFMAAAIYLCIRRIVYVFGPENSRIKPESYTRIFIPCDVISLILQSVGGAMASQASHSNTDPTAGNNLMIAGLATQVLSLFIFMLFCIDFGIRTYRRHTSLGSSAVDQNPLLQDLRKSWRSKGFVFALALSCICIFWRSVYRVAELAEGWTGSLIRKQNLFIAFEGVMVIVACLVLNFFHPSVMFKETMAIDGLGGVGKGFKKGNLTRSGRKNRGEKTPIGKSGSASDDGEAGKSIGVVTETR